MQQRNVTTEAERWAQILQGEFEQDVKANMKMLGDKPLFSQPMTDAEKRQKAGEVANDAAYWVEAIRTYGLKNAWEAQNEMMELLRGGQ